MTVNINSGTMPNDLRKPYPNPSLKNPNAVSQGSEGSRQAAGVWPFFWLRACVFLGRLCLGKKYLKSNTPDLYGINQYLQSKKAVAYR